MSLYGMMRTSVSGMAAQSNRLSSVADNIANSSTTGYKRARTEFSSMVLAPNVGSYQSGGVTTAVQTAVSAQGVLQYTTSVTDLAINGEGFFLVQAPDGTTYMSRAGSFVLDGEGNLVNAGGHKLMGYSLQDGQANVTANGVGGLQAIAFADEALTATPSTRATLTANLPAGAAIVTGAAPSANTAASTSSQKTSLLLYDNVGNPVTVDVHYTKTADNTWEVAVFDQKGATNGGFPYAQPALGTATLAFDPTTGKLSAASPTNLSFTVPNGAPLTLDLAKQTELAGGFVVLKPEANGNAPSAVEKVQIDSDGTVYAQYKNGALQALYRIPLATVASPDQLLLANGNVYSTTPNSGAIRVGFAEDGGYGSVVSGALESSNVDIAEELTTMIESQRSYTANSKVFQTGSELMDILVNLKR
ncbi:MAG: flagellar hook protein FlgE [Mesorhizobium amorphae]|nr:MAG: flagellar hook protein FlgE [Mesorhizobium amorphae]